MEFEMKSHVYIKVDEQGRILRCEGEYTLPADLDGWILIEEGTPCDRLNLAQSHYFDGGLYTLDGLPRYKYENNTVILRTEAELSTDRANIPEPAPTQLDKIEAQVTYTAMATDTLLEEQYER